MTDRNRIYVEAGIVRWVSSDNIPFDDMLEKMHKEGRILRKEVEASSKQRNIEAAKAIAEYCKRYKGPSDEERFEARAAFGPGEELINVFTGHKWTT